MWKKVCNVSDIPLNGGACVKDGDNQIAVFNYDNGKSFYAVNNMCPHQKQNVLSRGIIGDCKGKPKVVCPLHKKNYSLVDGVEMGDDIDGLAVETYQIEKRGDEIFLFLTE